MNAYHGTNSTFSEFDSSFCSKSSGNEQYGSGFYFTNQENVAECYGKLIYETELNLKNPYIIKSDERTDAIPLTREEIKAILLEHPNIHVPADDTERSNPIGDWSEQFWNNCNAGDKNFDRNIEKAINEVVEMLMPSPNLLNLDMFYEDSGVPKDCFLNAVKNATGHDGIIVNGDSNTVTAGVDIYIAWFPEQVKIKNIKELEEVRDIVER